MKVPNEQIILNPIADKNGAGCAVEYAMKKYALKFKLLLQQSDFNVKQTEKKDAPKQFKTIYENHGHKVEVTLDANRGERNMYEVAHEGVWRNFSIHHKLTPAFFEQFVAKDVTKTLTVGGGSSTSLKNYSMLSWKAGLRYVDPRFTVSVITEAMRRFETTVFAPVKLHGRNCMVACQAKCEKGRPADICVGLEAPCMFVQGAMLRAKYSRKDGATLAYYKTFAENWKASLTWGQNSKLGLLLTRE